jgi:DNA repair exonuclease SbcCD ATPase subunit
MDVLDSSIRVVQTVLPPAIQYFGKAKQREAKLAQIEEELAQTRAENEVLVIKYHELAQFHAQASALEKENEELSRRNANLEAITKIVLVLIVVAAVVYVGMSLSSEAP